VNGGLRGDHGGAPAIFSAQITNLALNQSGNFDTQTLQPGFRTPYWIDEIRITALMNRTFASGGVIVGYPTGLAGALELRFTTGQYSFSRAPVPMGLLAPRWSRYDFGVYQATTVGALLGVEHFATIRWPLPKPLYMPAGDALQCLAHFNGAYPSLVAIGLPVAQINLAYVGRIESPGTSAPSVRNVPWVSSFAKKAGVTYAQTNDEFRNPFMKSLYVQRFTSRTFVDYPSVGLPPSPEFFETLSNQGEITTEPYTEARLYDSMGYAIVKEYVPVNDVFDGTRGAWTFGRTLNAREQFDLQLRQIGASTAINTMVGLVGYREEAIR